MRSKKLFRSLLPGVHHLLLLLVNAHPLVFIVSPHRENTYDQGVRPPCY